MRKLGTVLAALGLAAAIGATVPVASAQASTQSGVCGGKWIRNGYVYAWDGYDCAGSPIGKSAGNDSNWNDSAGDFRAAGNKASSVMNGGYLGGKDVVAFYYFAGSSGDYACLAPGEKYADNLSDNTFTNGAIVNNNIMSHLWVTASACASGTWIG